jgi:hypothetical protein
MEVSCELNVLATLPHQDKFVTQKFEVQEIKTAENIKHVTFTIIISYVRKALITLMFSKRY